MSADWLQPERLYWQAELLHVPAQRSAAAVGSVARNCCLAMKVAKPDLYRELKDVFLQTAKREHC
jgi:hypothetical protein